MITTIKEWKKFNENILVPRNLEGRKEKLRQQNIKLLSQDVIEGNLEIDESFDGIPEELVKVKEINGHVRLTTNIDYIPSWLKDVKIYGSFECQFNKLKTLENCPQYIGGSFYCNDNKLTSLEGCPKYIGGSFSCERNYKILHLPEGVEIKGDFYN